MSIIIQKDIGKVVIDNEVIARIAGIAAMDCYGIIGMAAKSVKDDVFHLLKLESLTKGVKLSVENDLIALKLHIIVEYGTNIPAIADSMINNVKYKIEDAIGLKVSDIDIYVEGMRVH